MSFHLKKQKSKRGGRLDFGLGIDKNGVVASDYTPSSQGNQEVVLLYKDKLPEYVYANYPHLYQNQIWCFIGSGLCRHFGKGQKNIIIVIENGRIVSAMPDSRLKWDKMRERGDFIPLDDIEAVRLSSRALGKALGVM